MSQSDGVKGSREKDALLVCLYITVGLVITGWFFVRNLDTPWAFNQNHDNTMHLNVIRYFLDSGNYSPLINLSSGISAELAPAGGGASFYPSAWHLVAAFVAEINGGAVVIAENASIFALIAISYPLSVLSLISSIFRNDRIRLLCGAVISLSFGAFPWLIIAKAGPLFPFVAGLIFVPGLQAAFIDVVDSCLCKRIWKVRHLVFFSVCLLGLAFIHPSAVFSLAVCLIPYCIERAWKNEDWYVRRSLGARALRTGLIVLLISCIWVFMYRLPLLQSVVGFDWPKTITVVQGVVNALTLSFATNTTQIILAIFLMIGFLVTFFRPGKTWISVTFVFACSLYVISAGTEIPLKALLTGFWYTDPNRLASTAIIAAIPLVVEGFAQSLLGLGKALSMAIDSADGKIMSKQTHKGLFALCFALICCGVFFPSFTYPGQGDITTAFGSVDDALFDQYQIKDVNFLDKDEQDFVYEVKNVIPQDALVLNMADDGSMFAYGTADLNVYYKTSQVQSNPNESKTSRLLRNSLCDISRNQEVRDAVKQLDAHYVLILDEGGIRDDSHPYYLYYNTDDWKGFNDLTASTEGFSVVLQQGDMMLLKIDDKYFE